MSTQRILWYPPTHKDLRLPLLRRLTNLQRWNLLTVWSEMTDEGNTYYVIAPLQKDRPLTASQRDEWRRFQQWFNDHNYLT
jgi:hypothetical protein